MNCDREKYWFPTINKYKILLISILLISLLLRLILVFRGGQLFWPDESRYWLSHKAVSELQDGDILSAIATIFARAHHIGYKALGVIPAYLENIFGANLYIPGVFVSFFSVFNIYLIWVLTRKLGGTERVALFGVFFFAISTEMLIWARHIVPYDEAMTFGLLALIMAVSKNRSIWNSLITGLLACACFLTYLGYWTLAGIALLVSVFFERGNMREVFIRWLVLGMGFAAPTLTLFIGTKMVGYDLFGSMAGFVDTVVLGDFTEGWSFPFEYMWQTEGILFVLWMMAFFIFVVRVIKGERRMIVIVPLASSMFLYLMFVLFSVGLEKFVVYGRLVRQFVPLLSLLTAVLLSDMFERGWYKTAWVICGMMIAATVCNFYIPLTMTFPEHFAKQVELSLGKGNYKLLNISFIQPQFKDEPIEYFLPLPSSELLPPHKKIVLQKRHPQQYKPFQYEGYTPAQRRKFRLTDFSMKAVIDK